MKYSEKVAAASVADERVLGYKPLARKMAMNYWRQHADIEQFEDCMQLALWGVFEALATYEDDKGACEFSWVYRLIKQRLEGDVRKHWLRENRRALRGAFSIDVSPDEDLDGLWFRGGVVLNSAEASPDSGLDLAGELNLLEAAMPVLDLRERTVVSKRFSDGVTLQEIADEFGVSRERVRQLEARALRKLKASIEEMRPDGFD